MTPMGCSWVEKWRSEWPTREYRVIRVLSAGYSRDIRVLRELFGVSLIH